MRNSTILTLYNLSWGQIAQHCWFNITTSLFLFNEAEINNMLNHTGWTNVSGQIE